VTLIASDSQYGFFGTEVATTGRALHDQYVSAQPFPHVVLDDFLDEEILDRCAREFPQRSAHATYDRAQEKGKSEFKPETLSAPLRSLFYSFNSLPFIEFLQNLTGISGLVGDPHFMGGGLHEVVNGGHLNIHADFNHHEPVNLERRVNVLIYLNRDWKEEYGGCFEMWDHKMAVMVAKVVPLFNRCVIFNTSSTSLHGHPEPIRHPAGASRRAIALYYYTATWDAGRWAHSTRFKQRPGSKDAFDLALRTEEIAEAIVPPVVLRAVRRLIRVVRS